MDPLGQVGRQHSFENLSLLSILYFEFCKSEELMFDMLIAMNSNNTQ